MAEPIGKETKMAAAKAAIENHLSKFFQKPSISLDISGFNSSVYYVIFDGGGFGEQVNRFPFTGNETVLDAIARKHATDWAGLLKTHPAQGRSILAKVLRAKLEFKPERQRGKRGVRFSARASIVPLLTGLVPVFHERVGPQRESHCLD
jgi:hypothetical protein